MARPSWDDADVAVALEYRERNVRHICHVSVKAKILEKIMHAETIAGRSGVVDLAITDNDIAASLDQKPEAMRTARPERQHSMQ